MFGVARLLRQTTSQSRRERVLRRRRDASPRMAPDLDERLPMPTGSAGSRARRRRSVFDKLPEGVASLLNLQANNPGQASTPQQRSGAALSDPRASGQFDAERRRGGSVSVLGSITVNTPSR
jgi:hypothetical protein